MSDDGLKVVEVFLAVLGQRIDETAASTLIETFRLARDGSEEEGYLESERAGLSLRYDVGRVDSVFLHAEGKDGFSAYRGALPFGLAFGSKVSEVRRKLGPPDRSSGPMISPYLRSNGWDRYDFEGFYLHFTYRLVEGSIELVTLGSVAQKDP